MGQMTKPSQNKQQCLSALSTASPESPGSRLPCGRAGSLTSVRTRGSSEWFFHKQFYAFMRDKFTYKPCRGLDSWLSSAFLHRPTCITQSLKWRVSTASLILDSGQLQMHNQAHGTVLGRKAIS